jgi:glycine/D-amino acid oxidase-like deaminating enzyme
VACPGGFPPRRPSLPGPVTADVRIVGAGYTGLWTAYYLKQAEPSLRIVVLEAAFAGFGASGRSGGWLTSALPGSRERYARGPGGRDAVLDLQRQLRVTVDRSHGPRACGRAGRRRHLRSDPGDQDRPAGGRAGGGRHTRRHAPGVHGIR